MRKIFFLELLLLTSLMASSARHQSCDKAVEKQLRQMSIEQKVGQLFFVRPEALVDTVTDAHIRDVYHHFVMDIDSSMRSFDERYPVGGICLFAHNIKSPEQVVRFTEHIHSLPGRPIVCVDEEGGRVARIGRNDAFALQRFPPMGEVAETQLPQNAYFAAAYMGSYLRFYGFDLNFAPIADVNTNSENNVIGSRAFGSNPDSAALYVSAYVRGLQAQGVTACLKHFPGHGDTNGDSHKGFVFTNKTWEQIRDCEMITFRAGIEAGVRVIMTAHIAAPQVTDSDEPSTMSHIMLTDKLRRELGFDGLIMSDALEMAAIREMCSPEEACIRTFLAGADIIMLPLSFPQCYQAVVEAVRSGRIPIQRLDESVRRILLLKQLYR